MRETVGWVRIAAGVGWVIATLDDQTGSITQISNPSIFADISPTATRDFIERCTQFAERNIPFQLRIPTQHIKQHRARQAGDEHSTGCA